MISQAVVWKMVVCLAPKRGGHKERARELLEQEQKATSARIHCGKNDYTTCSIYGMFGYKITYSIV